jgi:hypothetical protein
MKIQQDRWPWFASGAKGRWFESTRAYEPFRSNLRRMSALGEPITISAASQTSTWIGQFWPILGSSWPKSWPGPTVILGKFDLRARPLFCTDTEWTSSAFKTGTPPGPCCYQEALRGSTRPRAQKSGVTSSLRFPAECEFRPCSLNWRCLFPRQQEQLRYLLLKKWQDWARFVHRRDRSACGRSRR